MLENLFSSKIMFQILSVLFSHEDKNMSTSEIIKETNKKQANIAREVDKLVKWGMVIKTKQSGQNYYQLNEKNAEYDALKNLFLERVRGNKKYFLVNEEGGACLLSIHYFAKGFSNDLVLKTDIFKQHPYLVSHLKDNYARFYMVKDSFEKCSKESLEKLLKDPSFVNDLIYKRMVDRGEEGMKIFKELQEKNNKVSKSEALELLNRFVDIINTQMSMHFIAVMDLIDYPYTNYIKKYIEDKIAGTDLRLHYLLEKLLAPEDLTWTQKLRIDLLKLAIDHKENKSDYSKATKKIWQDWLWLNYGHRGPAYEQSYFDQVIKELVDKKIPELKDELRILQNNKKEVTQKKQEIFKQLNIDKKHQDFINALSLLSYLKIYRKDTAFLLIYLTYEIIEQFNKGNIKRENLMYLTLEEAAELIRGNLKITRKELQERERNCVHVAETEKLLVGKEADKFIAENTIKEKEKQAGEPLRLLEGNTACLGETGNWVYGEIRVINEVADMEKMQEGDILVSVATTPDILSAMKKASAIVTDHGGITCHAAIVSRELNIPCLIGTKYATKVFKDGDKVVVCPRHGYIKFQ